MNDVAMYKPVRCSEITRTDLSLIVAKLVGEAALIAGQEVSQSAMAIIIEVLPKDIQTRFRMLELAEIKKAFDDGVRGYYGEWYGLNTVTCNKWLKGYVDSGDHSRYIESKINTNTKLLAEKAPLTPAEIDDIIRAGIVKCFNDYKNTGVVLDFGSPKINWLLVKGIITPTQEEKEEYKEQAREQLTEQAQNKASSVNRNDRREGKRELEEMINILDTDSKIQSLAKNLCLKRWFEEILESGLDISEVIK